MNDSLGGQIITMVCKKLSYSDWWLSESKINKRG